jgi:hypothetical protein
MPFTTFDPATIINVTLSGSNLIATRTGSGGAKALHPKRSSKWYWEMTAAGAFSSSNLGILNGTHTDFSAIVGAAPSSLRAVVVNSAAGTIAVNGVSSGISIGGYFTAGGLLCFALDLDNKLLWVRLGAAGNWNAAAANNPATGVGGVNVTTAIGPGFYALPAVALFGAGTSCTANFGASAFTGTAPTGFVGWDDVADPGSTNEVISQVGAEPWYSGTPAVQVTQIGAETWLAGTPDVQLTQIGAEVWMTITPASVVLTQVGVEVWQSVPTVPQGGPMISVIM